MKKLTQRQKEVLDCIQAYIIKNTYPPTVREISDMMNIPSTSAVHQHLVLIEQKGYISVEPARARAIKVLV